MHLTHLASAYGLQQGYVDLYSIASENAVLVIIKLVSILRYFALDFVTTLTQSP